MRRALQWRIILVAVLVYLAGTATGFFAGGWQAQRAFEERRGRMVGERIRERMKHRLDLTPEQEQAIDPILGTMSQRLRVIRQETAQRVEQTMEEAHRDLARHLKPEQMEQLERMKKRHKRILKRRRGHGAHEHSPPGGF